MFVHEKELIESLAELFAKLEVISVREGRTKTIAVGLTVL